MKLEPRDVAIAIWEYHRERSGEDLNDFKDLQDWEKEVLISAAKFALRYM